MNETTYIYGLSDPINNQMRYVGKADNPNSRLSRHISEKNINHKTCWIKSLLLNNLYPKLEILDEIPKKEWEFWEQFYISLFRSWGFDLVNSTNGGDGGIECIVSKEVVKKRTLKLKGQKRSAEQCEKIRQGRMSHGGWVFSKEARKNMGKSHKGKMAWNKGLIGVIKLTEETKRKISESNKGKKRNEETKLKLRIAAKLKPHHKHTEETKLKISRAMMGQKPSADTIEKMRLHSWARSPKAEIIKEKIRIANTEKKRTEEAKYNMSIAHKKNINHGKL